MRILMYHDIVRDAAQEIHSVSMDQFSAQMRWLHDMDYQIITAETWFAAQQSGKRVPRNAVSITFDDGYQDNYTLAWPILRDHGFTATIYLVTGAIAGTSTWRDGSFAHSLMLSPKQIVEMADQGMTFGSHTVTHPRLTRLPGRIDIDRELVESKKMLEGLLQREVVSFCYPHSAVNPEIKRRVQAASYQMALTYEPGYVGAPGRDAFQLHRIGILASDTLDSFAQKVQAPCAWRARWYWRRLKQVLRGTLRGSS